MYFIKQLLQCKTVTHLGLIHFLNSMFDAVDLLYRSSFSSSWMQMLLHRRKWKVTRLWLSIQLECKHVCMSALLPFHPHEKGTIGKLEFLGVLVYFLCPRGAYSLSKTGAPSAIHTLFSCYQAYIRWNEISLPLIALYRESSKSLILISICTNTKVARKICILSHTAPCIQLSLFLPLLPFSPHLRPAAFGFHPEDLPLCSLPHSLSSSCTPVVTLHCQSRWAKPISL